MKRIYILVFLLLPALIYGQSGGARLGPLRLPFEFKITVYGLFHGCSDYSNTNPPGFASYGFDQTIKPNDSNAHLSHDTITYIIPRGPHSPDYFPDSLYIRMIFDTTSNTIQDLAVHEDHGDNMFLGFSDYSANLELTNLSYDTNAIFCSDTNLNNHLRLAGNYYSWKATSGNTPVSCDSLVYVTHIELSGNFRSSTLTEGVALPDLLPSGMYLVNDNGTEYCIFASSAHSRKLELYTTLGIRVAIVEVPAGMNKVALPSLSSGLYFLRIGEYVLKVIIL